MARPAPLDLMASLQSTAGNGAVRRLVEDSASSGAPADLTAHIDAMRGGGTPLSGKVRRRLEKGLGADLSSVRVHTGSGADALSRAMAAKAFTNGSDIFFTEGAYSPSSKDGLRLLAHEATHTVQQADGEVEGTDTGAGVSISDPSDRFEQAAEHSAEQICNGHAAGNASERLAAAAPSGAGASIQRYDWGSIGRGLWDGYEAIPVLGNALSAGTAVGHSAMSLGYELAGNEEAANREDIATHDNLLNAIPIYGNIRAAHQAQRNFAGGNAEAVDQAVGGSVDRSSLGVARALRGAPASLWENL